MGQMRPRRKLAVVLLFILAAIMQPAVITAQGVPRGQVQSWSGQRTSAEAIPIGAPTFVPINSDTVTLSSGMVPQLLPPVPRLDMGFSYSFGRRFSSGQFSFDYLFPTWSGPLGLFFLEGHSEYLGFWRTYFDTSTLSSTETYGAGPQWTTSGLSPLTRDVITDTTQKSQSLFNFSPERLDISVGGGYRRLINGNNLVGINAFYDTSRIATRWYPSWGIGIEAAGLF